ncbi:MAG: hypothetical protein AAFU54_20080 [Chloroflexota bacterium]
MPVNFYIDSEQNDIFCWEFIGTWTAEEVIRLHDRSNDMARERAPLPIFSIVDLRQSAPPPVSVFSGLATVNRNGAENWVMSILIVEEGLWLRLLRLALRTNSELRKRYRIAGSVEEAYQMIQVARSRFV